MSQKVHVEAASIQGVDIYMAEALTEACGVAQDCYVEYAAYSPSMAVDMHDVAESHLGTYLGIPENATNASLGYKLERQWDTIAGQAIYLPRVITGGDVLASDVASKETYVHSQFKQESELPLDDLDFHYGLLGVIIREKALKDANSLQ